jgi:integrase
VELVSDSANGLSGERTAIEELVTLEGLNPDDHLWATRPGGGRLQLMLGHASIQTTSDLYVHTQVRDVRRRTQELEEADT